VLWGRAAGRCQYAGCNKLLIGEQISGARNANKSYIAHIVGDSPDGPRGDAILSPKLAHDPDILYRSGLIVPRLRVADHGAADQFAPEDLDAFLQRLLDGAKLTKTVGRGRVNIPDAARFACCTSETVVRLILDGKVQWKWRLTSERGYMSVLVDVEEIRALVRGPDHGGYTAIALSERLQTTHRVVRALITRIHLKTLTVTNPINRCPTVIVPAKEVDRFEREYISLFMVAKQQGRHFRIPERSGRRSTARLI
jgi:hypothetical protein